MKDCRSSKCRHRRDPARIRNRRRVRLASLRLAAVTLLPGFLGLLLLIGTATASAQDGKYVVTKMPGRVKAAPAGEAASGQATARKHISNIKYDNFKLNVARDAASGKATGKRSYKPITFTKRPDKASPMMAAPSKQPAPLHQGGLLDGNTVGGATTGSPAATGSPINRGGAPAGRLY